jgi:hypothetical protein
MAPKPLEVMRVMTGGAFGTAAGRLLLLEEELARMAQAPHCEHVTCSSGRHIGDFHSYLHHIGVCEMMWRERTALYTSIPSPSDRIVSS